MIPFSSAVASRSIARPKSFSALRESMWPCLVSRVSWLLRRSQPGDFFRGIDFTTKPADGFEDVCARTTRHGCGAFRASNGRARILLISLLRVARRTIFRLNMVLSAIAIDVAMRRAQARRVSRPNSLVT